MRSLIHWWPTLSRKLSAWSLFRLDKVVKGFREKHSMEMVPSYLIVNVKPLKGIRKTLLGSFLIAFCERSRISTRLSGVFQEHVHSAAATPLSRSKIYLGKTFIYRLWLPKDSLGLGSFPEHEYRWGLIVGRAEEVCINCYLDLEHDMFDYNRFEEADETDLDHQFVYELINQIYQRDNRA